MSDGVLCLGVDELGISRTKIAADPGMTQAGIGYAVNRWAQITPKISLGWLYKLYIYGRPYSSLYIYGRPLSFLWIFSLIIKKFSSYFPVFYQPRNI